MDLLDSLSHRPRGVLRGLTIRTRPMVGDSILLKECKSE